MRRPENGTIKTRLTLELPSRVRARLEELQAFAGADSMTEVIRRALVVYDVLLTSKSEGKRLFFRNADGTETEVLIIA